MWTVENRVRYNRDRLRYPSDLTDAECNRGKLPGLRAGAKIGGVILSCLWRAWTLIRLLLCQRVTFAG
jgi:hypothetical protein